jgi:hypothetical protein
MRSAILVSSLTGTILYGVGVCSLPPYTRTSPELLSLNLEDQEILNVLSKECITINIHMGTFDTQKIDDFIQKEDIKYHQ